MAVHSETGPLSSVQSAEETITPVPEDFVRRVTSVVGTLPSVATPSSEMVYGQISCVTTPSLTSIQNTIMVAMLDNALQTVNA